MLFPIKTISKNTVLAFSLLSGLTISLPLATSAETSAHPTVTAPSFSLMGVDGATHSLSEYKGKIVVLEWFNSGCPFVAKHYESGNMQRLQKEYTARDVVWLTITSSADGKQGAGTPAEHMAQMKSWNMTPTQFLMDPAGEAGKKYAAKTTPHMFVVDKKGMLVYQGAIDSVASTKKEDVEKAENYVKKALDEVLMDKPVALPVTTAYGCSVKYAS